jgi:hypothetical protein
MTKTNIDKLFTPIRLALRVEGDWWVAYIAKTGTMDGAFEIARVAMGIVRPNERLKQLFVDLAQGGLEDALRSAGADPISWSEEPAPQHERSGRA